MFLLCFYFFHVDDIATGSYQSNAFKLIAPYVLTWIRYSKPGDLNQWVNFCVESTFHLKKQPTSSHRDQHT